MEPKLTLNDWLKELKIEIELRKQSIDSEFSVKSGIPDDEYDFERWKQDSSYTPPVSEDT